MNIKSHIIAGFVMIVMGIFLWMPVRASAATLYYNAAVDNEWDTLGNWWQNSGYTVPAVATPGAGDSAVLGASVSTGPQSPTTVINLTLESTIGCDFNGDITITGVATFGITNSCPLLSGTITGNAIFNNVSYTSGTIDGNVTFNDISGNENGTVTGVATFNDSAHNNGTVDSAIFNDTSYNNGGTVTGTAKFTYADNGTITISNNQWRAGTFGLITDTDDVQVTQWVFNDSNNNGTVSGDAVFNGDSTNNGDITGDAEFNDLGVNEGDVGGIAKFNNAVDGVMTIDTDAGYYYWGAGTAGSLVGSDDEPITDWVFNDDSENDGDLDGDAVFNDDTFNYGTVNGEATFNDTSSNEVEVIGTATFNDSSENNDTVTGDAIFNDDSTNNGDVTGDAAFNCNSVNNGTVTGTITTSPSCVTAHTITSSSGDHGSISPSGAVSVADGDSQTFTITPDQNYEIASLLVDAVEVTTTNSYQFTNVTADHTISVEFRRRHSGGSSGGASAGASSASISTSSPTPNQSTQPHVQAQIDSILKQIRSLQLSLSLSAIPHNITFGDSGDDVKNLQKFLINLPDANLALKQAGPTGYFGLITKAALIAFQTRVGIIPATGTLGPKTKAYIESHGLEFLSL